MRQKKDISCRSPAYSVNCTNIICYVCRTGFGNVFEFEYLQLWRHRGIAEACGVTAEVITRWLVWEMVATNWWLILAAGLSVESSDASCELGVTWVVLEVSD